MRPLLSLASGLWCLAFAPGARGQVPAESPALRVDVRLVNVEVAVTDGSGKFIPDLKPQDFLIREDGVPQKVTNFAPTRAPVRVALLVEASPAVYLLHAEHLTAAFLLLRALRPEDEVALVTYARGLQPELPFTRDKSLVEQRLNSLGGFGLGMAEMNLLDAVAQTLDWLNPPPQRTAVVLIGTGLDSSSRTRWEELRQRVGASQVTFFTVAMGRLLREEPKRKKKRSEEKQALETLEASFTRSDDRLEALAKASAGEAFFPQAAAELERHYAEIAERLRNLYSLGYTPSNPTRDGAYGEISVQLVDGTGAPLTLRDARGKPIAYRVFARPGYFAPRD